jgi:hypothetical protein
MDGFPDFTGGYPQQPGLGPIDYGRPVFLLPNTQPPTGSFTEPPTGGFEQSGPFVEAFPPLPPSSFEGSDGPLVESFAVVPEPSTMVLVMVGCFAAAVSTRFRKSNFRVS